MRARKTGHLYFLAGVIILVCVFKHLSERVVYLKFNSKDESKSIVVDKTFMSLKKPALERPAAWSPGGVGEFGIAAKLEVNSNDGKQEQLYNMFGENILLSNQISLHRKLLDYRHKS